MKFCKKCGSLMMPRKNEFVCGCGYKEESTGSTKLHETTT
ncbi:transcription factor S, partial [Candidatus Woesearchaeota archaeon]|nr:transcription factor S [Candidatus Woesearchaeota archaeon]